MTIEELNSVNAIRAKIENEKTKLDSLRTCQSGLVAMIDGLPKAKSQSSSTENLTMKILEAEARIGKLIEELELAMINLHAKICCELKVEREQRVMSLVYVAGFNFVQAASHMNYTKDYISKLHKSGLKKLAT